MVQQFTAGYAKKPSSLKGEIAQTVEQLSKKSYLVKDTSANNTKNNVL